MFSLLSHRLKPKDFTPREQTLKAYNNSKRKVIRIFTINVRIGLAQLIVEF